MRSEAVPAEGRDDSGPESLRLISETAWARIGYYRRSRRLARYLAQHLTEPLPLAKAAGIACMERTAFSRFFRSHIGMKFSDFLRAFRIERAIAEMSAGDRSLQEIAVAVGFNSLKTLERGFQREIGMSPSTYRARRLQADGVIENEPKRRLRPDSHPTK